MAEPIAPSRKTPTISFRTCFLIVLIFCAAFLGTFLQPPSSAQAGSKIATLNHNTGEFAVGYPHQRKVLRDASGYWYVVYMDYNGSTTKYEIYLTKSTNTAGTNWATPVKIAGENGIVYNESTYDFRYPSIEVNAARTSIHLVFNKVLTVDSGADDHVVYTQCAALANWNVSTGWTSVSGGTSPRYNAVATTTWASSTPKYAPTVGVDSTGQVHILYISLSSTYYIYYTTYTGGSWSTPYAHYSSSAEVAYPTIEIRSNNWIYCAWSLYSATYGSFTRVNYTYYNTGEASPVWSTVTYLILQNGTGVDLRYPSMAADDEGNIQVAVEQHGSGGSYPTSSIWGAYFNGSSWTTFQSSTPIDTLGWDKPVVGVTLGTGVTNDIIVAPRDGTDPDGVYRWKWGGTSWGGYEASTLETSDSFAALEKRAPSSSTSFGMVTFDAGASAGDLYFSRVRYSETTTTFQVAANSDDATEGYNTTGPVEGYMWLTGQYDRNRATTDSTMIRDNGVRFANVTVPANATVTGAFFEAYFYDDNTGDGLPPLNDDIDCTVYAQDDDNASTFTTTTFNITDTNQRPRTSASIPWQQDGLAGDYNAAAAWAGLHVLEPVQEVVSRSGWASGNALALLFIRNPSPSSTKSALWRARDYGSSYPKLTINYTTLGVDLESHSSGQVTDQLLGDAAQSNINLFRFQITNDRPNTTTVSQIQFQLSGISGIYTGDLSNIRIHDGTSNVATGGTASISGATGSITFTDWVLPAGPATRNYTLIADLGSLQPTETLTIALGTSNITLAGSLPVSGSAPSNATHTVDYPILLGEHASGQITDQFDSASSKNDVTLFRFKLTNTTSSAVAVDQVQFQLSSVTGIVGSDFSDLRIVPEGGGTVGGTASVWIASGSGTITFSDNFNVAALTTVNYELIGDMANLVTGDTMALSLGTSNVTLTSGTTSGTAPTSVTHTWNNPSVAGSADDSYTTQSSDNAAPNTGLSLIQVVSYFGASTQSHGGLRFPGIYIPQGSTITSAYLWVYVDGTANDDPRVTIHGDDTGNALDFSAGGNPSIVTRPRVATRLGATYQTSWSANGVGAGWKQLTVTKIVEGIVGRGDWASGNALALLLIAGTDNPWYRVYLRSRDYDTNGTYAPYLTVTFTASTTLAVGNHASGQVADAFDGNLSHNDKELFRFRLTNTTGSDATVDQIIFPLSSVSGISSGDLSDLKIKEGATEIVTGGVASIASGTGTITFTGDWTVPASQTKDYVLFGDVSNLQYPDTLTIALGSANITVVSGDASGSVSVSATHTADFAATLANYGTGQLTDQLDGAPTQNDRNLFRFRLVNTTVSDLTVAEVVLQLSSVTGIADTDLSDLRINNGTIDVTTGGVASIAAGSDAITFGTDFTLPSGATVDYTVIGDVANIVKDDTMTIALGTAKVTLAAGIVGGSAPSNVTHTGDDAATLGNHASGQLTDQFDSAPAKDNVSLFRFQLVNTTAADLTIDQVQFQLSAITGIVTSNLSDLRINNGTTDVATGGSPNISGETGTITFTGDFTLPASATVNYTLIGDVISLASGDTVTIGLGTANVTLLAGSLGGTAPSNVTHTTKWPRVSASADDAYVVDGTDDTTSYLASTLVTVRYNSTPANRRHGGFRIPGIYIPWVSTINSATLYVYVGDTYDDPPLDVYGHLTPNAPDFSTNTQIYARPRTTATVEWTEDNIGFGWKTVNVTSILQELVNQADWQNGNAAAFLFIARTNFINGGYYCDIHAWDYDSNHTEAAYLEFTYTPQTTLALGNHASGQAPDAFDGNLSQNDKDLYRFQLSNTTDSVVTIDQIIFNLSAISGILTADLSDLRINDGTSDVVTGGTPDISGATGTVTFTTDWTIAARATKNYTLRGDAANLIKDNTLTIALSSSGITLVSGDVGGSVSATATHTADDAATLANCGTGQLTDQLDGAPAQNDRNLFRFRLVNTTVSDLTVDQVVLQLSSVAGIADTDLADLRINNGTINVTTGGVASIAAGSGTITFSTDFTLPASATVDYTVIGDVANIVKNDTMTMALGTAHVTLAAGIVGGSAPDNVTHTADDAATLGNHASGQLTDQFDSAPAKDNVSLFRFQLVNTTAVDLTIDQVQFQLSAITGIVTSNLSDLRINNGTTDVATGGSPNISGETGTITFTGDFTLPASATVNYTLIGDALYLTLGDTVTIALGTANVTLPAGSLGGTAPTNVTHTTNWPQMSASADDAYVDDSTDDTTSYLTATQIRMVFASDPVNRQHGGFRIPGVYIPQGATINSATLNVYVGDTYDDPRLDVYGHLTPNAPDFSTNTQIYARPRTTATVAWAADNVGFGWKTVNVTSILQELVNQAEWEIGNAAAFLFIARSFGGYRCYFHAWDYDSNHSEAAYLTFSYTPTVVKLKSFEATGIGKQVKVEWKTGYEVDNLGFHLYREENGHIFRLTPSLIAGSALLAGAGTPLTAGHSYSWWDDLSEEPITLEDRPIGLEERPFGTRGPASGLKAITSSEAVLKRSNPQVSPEAERSSSHAEGMTVAYWLEDIDLHGKHTWHGPIEVNPPPLGGQASVSLAPQLSAHEPAKSALLSKLGRESLPRGNRGKTLQASAQLSQVSSKKLKRQWEIAARPAVKFLIQEEGWYRVSQPDLVASGLNPGINPRYLQLFVDGKELPISVTGEEDKRFDPQDAIEFYGMGLDAVSTDQRIYWLVAGARPGKRIPRVTGQGGQSGASSFHYTVTREDRTIYFSALKNGSADNFFGPVVATEPVDQILTLSHLAPPSSGNALLVISFQGVTQKPHRVKVWLNEIELGEVTFEGQALVSEEFTLPQSWLFEGDNLVTVEAQGDETDVSLIDSIQLAYWRTFTAEGDSLGFTAQGGKRVMVDGFSGSQIRVMDVTRPEAVREVAGTVNLGNDGFAIEFRAPRQGNRTLLAFGEDQVKEPAAIRANQPSTWHQVGLKADMVIIAHGDFIEKLAPLKQYRETQGYSVTLIDAEDLYDEFSFGMKTPQAIKDFLARAHTSWQTPPRFVLLVGDASFDPKNYLGLGNFDFLPTKLLDTTYMETASDDWFVDFDNDGLPDIAIGRLPVQTAEETTKVVSKIVAYGQAAAGAWATEALMVADENGDFDFEQASQQVGDLLPPQMTVWSVNRGQAGDEAARAAILGSINEGKLIVNYIGHGAVDLWKSSLLATSDTATLTNGTALPLVVGMTCLNGFFQTPYTESLAEALLKAENGGAVAVWTSSGLTDPYGQSLMNKAFFRLLFNGQGLTLGEAAAAAKAATNDQDVRRSWILFGDPATKLRQ